MELIKTQKALRKDKVLRERLSEIVELDVQGNAEIINMIQVFQKVGLDRITKRLKRPLEEVRAACYITGAC